MITTQCTPLTVAHRGSARSSIENTLPAFQQAVDDGAQVIELDIHLTADKDLAVIHDDTLERTHNNPGEVRNMTSQELRALGVPMLGDVLQMTQTPLFVEIKQPKNGRHDGIEQVLVDQLDRAQADARTVVISFDETSLKKVRELDAKLATGYLYVRPVDIEKKKDELGIQYVAPHYALVDREYVEKAHAAGLKVDAWLVNRPKDMQRMTELQVDAITTDKIPQLQDVLGGNLVQIPDQQNRLAS